MDKFEHTRSQLDRYSNPEKLREEGLKDLEDIEGIVQSKLEHIAQQFGGEYIKPTQEEIEDKWNKALDVNPYVFYSHEDDYIWSPGGKAGHGSETADTYNKGDFGFIVNREKAPAEPVTRVYRGATYDPKQRQLAPLARVDGVELDDLDEYLAGRKSMEEVISQVQDEHLKDYLTHSLVNVRRRAEKNGASELEEIKFMHTWFTSGALDIDLWVSAAKDPSEVYAKGGNRGNTYANFLGPQGIDCTMIIDVPSDKMVDYNSEVGITGELKKEWIRAIIPNTSDREKRLEILRQAEQYLKTKENSVDTKEGD